MGCTVEHGGLRMGGGPSIGAEPKWRQAENGVKKPKFGAFVSFFFAGTWRKFGATCNDIQK